MRDLVVSKKNSCVWANGKKDEMCGWRLVAGNERRTDGMNERCAHIIRYMGYVV